MPYIKDERRKVICHQYAGYSGGPERLDPPEDPVCMIDVLKIENCGELNYAFTVIINEYFKNNPRYQSINDIVGALEGAKLEFYRRVAVDYENEKIEENGDCF